MAPLRSPTAKHAPLAPRQEVVKGWPAWTTARVQSARISLPARASRRARYAQKAVRQDTEGFPRGHRTQTVSAYLRRWSLLLPYRPLQKSRYYPRFSLRVCQVGMYVYYCRTYEVGMYVYYCRTYEKGVILRAVHRSTQVEVHKGLMGPAMTEAQLRAAYTVNGRLT